MGRGISNIKNMGTGAPPQTSPTKNINNSNLEKNAALSEKPPELSLQQIDELMTNIKEKEETIRTL
jgi:hypothetical protein